jgi:methylmalonyl-CoA mutase cobalamin-binding domain/chain
LRASRLNFIFGRIKQVIDFLELENLMADLAEDKILETMNVVSQSEEGVDQALEAMRQGMEIVGGKFESGEYFVSDLIYAGEIMTEAMQVIKPLIKSKSGGSIGRILLCTVKGDLHDIGKNIVKAMMEASGFEVTDLGIDVSSDKIVQSAKEQNIRIIALSGVLTLAINSMRDVIKAFEKEGIRDHVKILIGGNPVSEENCKSIGADEWAHSPQKGINVCKEWVKSVS